MKTEFLIHLPVGENILILGWACIIALGMLLLNFAQHEFVLLMNLWCPSNHNVICFFFQRTKFFSDGYSMTILNPMKAEVRML